MIRLYYKSDSVNWDDFDSILLQLTMHTLNSEVDQTADITDIEKVKAQFLRRAQRKEFPVAKFIIYLNSAVTLVQDIQLMHELLKYGLDVLYPKLQWTDKVNLIDLATKA
jgi:hypothetical protein